MEVEKKVMKVKIMVVRSKYFAAGNSTPQKNLKVSVLNASKTRELVSFQRNFGNSWLVK